MIGIDWSKQEALNGDPEAIQQFKFIGNLEQAWNVFIIEEEKTS